MTDEVEQLRERVELLEVFGQQAVSTIEFLHGCLTNPGFSYEYPHQTLRFLEELSAALPPREWCVHSRIDPECQGCQHGIHAREVMARFRAQGEVNG